MKKSRLNPVSKSKTRRQKRFMPKDVIAQVLERSGGVCERTITYHFGYNKKRERCWRNAEEIHHILARSQGGKHELPNLLVLCKECHFWATNNPTAAKREGIVIPYKGYVHGSLED